MPNTDSGHVPDRKTLEEAKVHFERHLRRHMLKLTSQRLDILERCAKVNNHFSVDDLAASFRRQKSRPSVATIYRTLSLLVDCDILEEHNFKSDSSSVYEFAWGRDHHDHLKCTACGTITEFFNQELENIQERLALENGFLPVTHSLKIYGICSECRAKGIEPAPSATEHATH